MAIRYWDYGAATVEWQTAANWSADTVPVADDEVIFDGRATTAPTGGMLDSESGATAQCTFDLLHFKKSWTAGVASAAEPLCCSPDKIIIDGSGTYYILVGKDNQSTDTTVGDVFINNKDATVYLYSNCNDGANVAEFTNVYLTAGTLHLSYYDVDTDDCGCSVANLYIMPKSDNSANCTVYIEKDAYDVLNSQATNIYMGNGTLTTDSMVGTFMLFDGTVNYGTDLAASPETDLNITSLTQYGGTFNWNPDDSGDDAYIGTLKVFGGTFDASSSTNRDRAKVLGNGAGYDVYICEGSTFNIANGMGNITLAASTQLWVIGQPTIKFDSYSQLAMTYDQP